MVGLPERLALPVEMSDADVYRFFAEQIIKEDTIINQRMGWGLTSNAAALTVVAAIYVACKDFKRFSWFMLIGFTVVLITSIYTSFKTIKAIQDARKQIYYIREIYDEHWATRFRSFGLPQPFGSRLTKPRLEDLFVKDYTLQLPDWVPTWLVKMVGLIYPFPVGREMDFKGKRPFWWWAERMLAAVIATWASILLVGLAIFFENLVSSGGGAQPAQSEICRDVGSDLSRLICYDRQAGRHAP